MEKKRQAVILVYGSPASGKSTFSQHLLGVIPLKTLLVHVDDIQIAFNNKQTLIIPEQFISQSCSFTSLLKLSTIKSKLFDPYIWKSSRDFVKSGIQKLKNICDILLIQDDFLLKSMRKPFKQFAALNQFQFLEIYMDTSLEECLELNLQRGTTVPQWTIKQKYQKIEITGVSLLYTQRKIDWLWIQCRLETPFIWIENDKSDEPQKPSLLEETQMQIRLYISFKISQLKNQKKFSSEKIKRISSKISALKKSFNLKQGVQNFKDLIEKYLKQFE